MKNVNKEIKDYINKADALALEHVEKIVRKVLKRNSKLHSFQMCMGTYFFCDMQNEILHNYESKELNDFIIEWDELLKITGNRIILEKSGEYILKRTKW